MVNRIQILEQAIDLIADDGERSQNYGTPEENFNRIADGWSVIFDQHVTAEQVALAMAWLKIARLVGNAPTVDSYVDAAAYCALAAELASGIDME
jgi:hypothetical protein